MIAAVEQLEGVMGGQPVVAGTRMPVSVILREAANGLTPEQIAAEYPAITATQVRTALEWAADQVGGQTLHAAE